LFSNIPTRTPFNEKKLILQGGLTFVGGYLLYEYGRLNKLLYTFQMAQAGRGSSAWFLENWVTYDTLSHLLRFGSLGRECAGHRNQMEFTAGR
jgi:hypothetical protein